MTDGGAPKLRAGTPMQVRKTPAGAEARTPVSKWHRVLQWWGRHHLTRERNGEWADNSGWKKERHTGPTPKRPGRGGLTREQLRQDMRLGRHAQDIRSEAHHLGGKEEKARYYGTGEFAGAESQRSERRVNITDAERQLRSYEATEREKYETPRRRRMKW